MYRYVTCNHVGRIVAGLRRALTECSHVTCGCEPLTRLLPQANVVDAPKGAMR